MIKLLLSSIMVNLFVFHSTAQSPPPWLTTGNAGTSPMVHFLGTTDNADLQFRINNTRVGLLTNNGNIFWGIRSGMSNTTGYLNIAIGTDALKNNKTNSNRIAIGDSALFNGGGIFTSLAIGSKALFSLNDSTESGYNVAIGENALYSTRRGYYNTAVGYLALKSALLNDNTAVGSRAMVSTTTGNYNTAVGSLAMSGNSKGRLNAALGYESLTSDGGDFNIAVGAYSLWHAKGHGNTSVGFWTMREITGSDNTAIGFTAELERPDLTNATVIGARATAECSNCLVLGSVKGKNYATNNVNVGIGQTNPGFPLNFADSLGDKISLYGRAGNHYGFGIQPALLQIHTDGVGSDIVFGYGSSSNFKENMRITGFGNLIVRGTITTNNTFYTSDSRTKTNIELIGDALDKLTQLNGYHYNWADHQQDQTVQSGVLAEEVQQHFPELVRADDKGFLSVNYVGLIPFLIESIKEQQKEIEQLKKANQRLSKLETELEEIKKLLKK